MDRRVQRRSPYNVSSGDKHCGGPVRGVAGQVLVYRSVADSVGVHGIFQTGENVEVLVPEQRNALMLHDAVIANWPFMRDI